MSDHVFLVMWDCYGLETCIDVTQHLQDRTWATLTNSKPKEIPNVNHLILRAKFNTQRHYEIYTVTAQSGITAEIIIEMFEASPQHAADTIRKLGKAIYSDRASSKVVIT